MDRIFVAIEYYEFMQAGEQLVCGGLVELEEALKECCSTTQVNSDMSFPYENGEEMMVVQFDILSPTTMPLQDEISKVIKSITSPDVLVIEYTEDGVQIYHDDRRHRRDDNYYMAMGEMLGQC